MEYGPVIPISVLQHSGYHLVKGHLNITVDHLTRHGRMPVKKGCASGLKLEVNKGVSAFLTNDYADDQEGPETIWV
jgi:hypothetical protein